MTKRKYKKKEFKILNLFYVTFFILGIVVFTIYLVSEEILFENIMGHSPLDRYSLYHFVSGILICSFFLIILTKYLKKGNITFIIMLAFMLTLILGIIFEMVENGSMIVDSDFKYSSIDSLSNMITDIILNSLGAGLLCYIYWSVLKNK